MRVILMVQAVVLPGFATTSPALAQAATGPASAPVGSWHTTVIAHGWAPVVTSSIPAIPRRGADRHHALAGIASFYWQDQMTANGERFDPRAMTAAHRTLPFNTMLRVTRIDSGRSVVVRVNDRGPFKPSRVIDLSKAAAMALGFEQQGLTRVRIDVLPGAAVHSSR